MAAGYPSRTSIFSLAVVALITFTTAIASTASATAHVIGEAWGYTIVAVRSFVDFGLDLFKADPMPPVIKPQFHRAQAYRQRQDKRERPMLSASWRMCPST